MSKTDFVSKAYSIVNYLNNMLHISNYFKGIFMDYNKALCALIETEGEKGAEITKKLVQLLAGHDGAKLLDVYLLEIKKQREAPGYPDLKDIEKSSDNQKIYGALKDNGTMDTGQLIEMLEKTDINKSLTSRTHMSARLNELKDQGLVGICGREGNNKRYGTSEHAVKNALGEHNLDKESAYRPENVWMISEDTELAPGYVLRILERI